MKIKEHLTLEQFENEFWGEPEYSSGLVLRCHELRKKPVRDFTIEDLRLMVGQGIGLKYLMPYAIKILGDNILAEGDLFEGDLLSNVLSKNTVKHWKQNKSDFESLIQLISKNKQQIPEKLINKIQKQIEFING